MDKIDESFKQEFKPLQIPSEYHTTNNWEDKTMYALACIEEGSAKDVANEIKKLEPALSIEEVGAYTDEILKRFFNKGLLKGTERKGQVIYNLSKIERPNSGKVNPDLL